MVERKPPEIETTEPHTVPESTPSGTGRKTKRE